MCDWNLPGWRLLGAFPDDEPDDVGSWLLHTSGEGMLLEIPPGLKPDHVHQALSATSTNLRYVTASHLHWDHFDHGCWKKLQNEFPSAEFIRPVRNDAPSEVRLELSGEPLWLIRAPKHSPSDMVAVFRGIAMTGDVELGTLDSVNNEVSRTRKAASMAFLRGFEERTGYKVHTIVSAHLNDFRQGFFWAELFGTDR
jgi:hypothetical protein